jgi:glycosyltransferase involved in cell wall biosynthesis
MRIPTTFYHHGDHHLCLGVFLRDVEHIDPHPMGYCNCKNLLKIRNTFVPLVVEDRRSIRAWFMEDGYLTTCTAARLNKIEISYYVNYLDVVPDLLKEGGGRHIHIGRLTPWALYRLRRRLRKLGVEQSRFVYIPWVPSVWDALVEHKVDLYVASFPYGGGLTLVEAMGAGIPVALHRHMYSRILSGLSLGYASAFSWHRKDDLIEHCKNMNCDALAAESKLSRKRYEQFHRTEVLKEVLSKEGVVLLAPSTEVDDLIETDTDELAQWFLNNKTFTNIFYQRAFRILKKARRRIIRASNFVFERLKVVAK